MPVSQGFTDDNLKSGAVAPFDGVCVFADDAFENTSVVVVVEANLIRRPLEIFDFQDRGTPAVRGVP